MRTRSGRTGGLGSPRSSRKFSSAAVGPGLLIRLLDHDAHVAIAEHIAEHAAANPSAVILPLAHAAAGDVDIIPNRWDQAKPSLFAHHKIGDAADLFGLCAALGQKLKIDFVFHRQGPSRSL